MQLISIGMINRYLRNITPEAKNDLLFFILSAKDIQAQMDVIADIYLQAEYMAKPYPEFQHGIMEMAKEVEKAE